jgi:hypothetical protein
MIQFLKPRKDRQRHLDVVESVQMPLPDVIDWLAAAAEESGLTDEEAAEIQIAFQQQSATDVVEPDEFSLDFGLESLAAPSAPESVEPLVALVPDPLDLSQIELSEPLFELAPAPVWSDLSRSVSVVESPVAELPVVELPVVEPPVVEPTVLAPTLVEAAPLALVDAEALVEIRLDTCAIAALPEAPVTPMLAAATEPEAGDLAIDATPVAAMIAGVINQLNDIPEAGLAIDDLSEAAATPTDWQNDNWASEAVDVAAVEAAEADPTPTSPLSYFQYYLDENAIGEGQAATDETPAPYVTPWRQPSMPGGLIGAGVLGATLVSGFVIADTVKTPQVTAVKRPTPPAPLQSLDPKNQPIAAVPPKVMPPESMQPEVALPKPKSATMSQPIFPAMAPIASSYGMSPLGSVSADLPQSNAGNGLSQSPTITARRAESSPVAAGPALGAPLRDLTPVSELPAPSAPVISRGTPVEPIRSTLPTPETAPAATPTSELPELQPDISVSQPETIAPETIVPETVTRATPSVLSELTPDPVSSTLQRVDVVNAAPVAPIADVVVPTAAAPIAPVAPVAPIVDQSAALSPTPTPELPAERVFTREEATAAPSTLPPVALAQPIADRTRRLPTQAQIQTLLAVPAVNAYVPMVAQWRPLTQIEASVAVNAPKLEGFTRQQLSPQDYRAAYRLVSEQADVLPSFGFIDYQRKLIILPPEPATASNPHEHSRSFHGAAIIAQRTTEL